jgi:hypothetical protein
VVILIAGLVLPLFAIFNVAGYTTPIVWSNKRDYDPSEMAYLYGYGFTPLTQVTVTIVRPDFVEDVVQTSTDEFGYFACQYLLDGIHGTFNVTATDGVNVATTTFNNSLYLNASWQSQNSIYIFAEAGGLSSSKQYYIKYFDPSGVERRQSPTHTGVNYFSDNLTILPTFPNILGWWTVKLYENGALKRTKQVCIDRIVWTTDSTYTTLVTSFAQGETVYFKTIGLKTSKYYRFRLEMPNGTKFYVSSWITGVTQMTGSYLLPSNAPLGTWKVHVRQADSGSGSCETEYVACCFQVTTPPPPQKYYLRVRTSPSGIGTILGEGWYNACTIVNLTAPEFFPGSTGTRYRFNYWDVDGSNQGAGVYGISVQMNANHTATAHYVTQYFLNLTTSPPGVTTPAGVGWYDTGTNAPIFAPEFVSIVPGASRYRFNGWTTGDMSEIADPSATSTTVLMDKGKTVTANYVIQYLVTFNQTGLDASASNTVATVDGSPKTYGDLPYSFWVDNGAVVSYSYSNPVSSSVSGKRFSLIGVSGPASPITVNSAVTVIGNYQTQYYLTVTSSYGTSSGSGWYNAGSTAYAALDVGTVDQGNGTRRVFKNWNGDASGTNYAQSDPITMDGPKTAVAKWKTQYKLTVRTSGLGTKITNVYNGTTILGTATDASPFTGWFDKGNVIQLDIDSPIYGSPTRYVFTQWTGDASGSGRPFSVTMSLPKDITANYKTQHEVTFTHTGLDSSATGTVVTVNGVPKAFGDLPYKIWVDYNAVVTYSYSNVSSTTSGKRFVLTGVAGPASPITVTGPATVTGNYKIQFEITFNQSGVGGDFTGTVVTVDSVGYAAGALPKSFWFDKDSSHAFAFSSPLVVDAGKQYVWAYTSGLSTLQIDTLTITGSGSVTGNYVVQIKYQVTFSQTGVGSDFTGTVVVIDSVNYKVADLPISFMWDSGSTHNFAFQSPLVVTANAKQYVWTSTTGLSTSQSGSITVSASGSVTGNYKTQYYLTVISPYGSPTPTSGWFDSGTSITASVTSPWSGPAGTRYVCTGWTGTGSVPSSGSASTTTFTITQASSITWNWKTQYLLTVVTDPSGLSPQPTRNPTGEAGPTNGWWYDTSTSVTLTAQTVTGKDFNYWDVDGGSKGSGVNPITVTMNAPHMATAHYTVTAPPISVSINPLSASIYVGQSVSFTSAVSGGTAPYTYQWYLNGNPVSGATSSTWTFTPSSSGLYYVYLKVTDSKSQTAQSETAMVSVMSQPPVGGYSFSLTKTTPMSNIAVYSMLVALFGVALGLTKRKRK